MTAAPSLAQNVHQLIRVHLTHDPTGRVTQQHALIDQLNAATTTTGNDGGRSNETRLLINVAAIDLQLEIRNTTRETEQARTGTPGNTRSILYSWTLEERPDWVQHLTELTSNFCTRITNTINPPPRKRQLHMPCPACGLKYAGEDRTPALHADVYKPDGTMKSPNEYHVECTQCGAEWAGEQIAWLTAA